MPDYKLKGKALYQRVNGRWIKKRQFSSPQKARDGFSMVGGEGARRPSLTPEQEAYQKAIRKYQGQRWKIDGNITTAPGGEVFDLTKLR